MSGDEKRAMLDAMMESFLGGLSAEEKREIMEAMMEKFLGGMSPEEKRALMMGMMPKMMFGMMRGTEDRARAPDTDEVADDTLERMRECCARMGFALNRGEDSAAGSARAPQSGA